MQCYIPILILRMNTFFYQYGHPVSMLYYISLTEYIEINLSFLHVFWTLTILGKNKYQVIHYLLVSFSIQKPGILSLQL